jgi:hypothetical protein
MPRSCQTGDAKSARGEYAPTCSVVVAVDFVLPTTDAGVAVQLGLWVVLSITGLVLTRMNKDFRLLVVGSSLLGFSLIALRAVH